MSIDTNDNRFHALKFALATSGLQPHEVTKQADAYLRFLEGQPEPAAPPQDSTFVPADPVDVELSDLTESYPADEPVAMADSPVEEELFEPHPPAMTDAEAEAQGLPTNTDQILDWLSEQPDCAREPEPSPEIIAVIEAPTEAEITAAVEQIADPAPASEDASEQPEMTDEQVERTEDHWRAVSDQIDAAEQKELEPVGGERMRFSPWFARK
ncbi:MAG TPA: hypothetical protein DCL48_15595 [Alphaproteobacteria bacterium]|nr:hypothetical protein [Alphaproteobacteria bacterium]